MDESLTERRRVQDEGLRVVNCFYVGRRPLLIALGAEFRILNFESILNVLILKHSVIRILLKIKNSKLKIPLERSEERLDRTT